MKASSELRPQAIVIAALLIGEYILGMLTNLFVAFPEAITIGQRWEFAKSQLLLVSHIVLGLAIVIGSLVLLIRAIRMKDRAWRIAAGIAFGSVLLAVISGAEFVSSQSANYSLSMSLLFILALGSLGWGIYKSKA